MVQMWRVVLMGVSLTLAAGVQAQAVGEYPGALSATPFIGYGGGGGFRDQATGAARQLREDNQVGVFLNMAVDEWRHYELFYLRQDTRLSGAIPLDVQYLQFGGSVSYPQAGPLIPYLGLTVGAARFAPAGMGMDSETRLAFSVGTGVLLPVSERIGLRLDLRALVSTFDTDGSVFCVAAGGVGACAIRARSSTLVQYAASVGVRIAF
jgi:hypothetical protein